MLGRIGKGEIILNERGKEFNERNRFKTATCKKKSLWSGLEYFFAGLGQAEAWRSSLRGVYREHTRVFLVPKGQAR